jgi:hypothetical protein
VQGAGSIFDEEVPPAKLTQLCDHTLAQKQVESAEAPDGGAQAAQRRFRAFDQVVRRWVHR